MKFKYVNSRGEVLDFSEFPYLFQSGDLIKYSWQYESVNNRITNIRREAGEKTFKVGLIPDWSLTYKEKRTALKEAADRLYSVIEYDVINKTNGRIETDTGSYLPCYILASDKSDWENPKPFMFYDLTAVSGSNAWVCEENFSFFAINNNDQEDNFLDYNFKYEYDYSPKAAGIGNVNIDHIAESEFKLTIYGPCVNPRVLINGHVYQVNTSLSIGEYMVINSRLGTIIKTQANGIQINCLNDRFKQSSVFQPIPPGDSTVTWDGSFGFDLTVYEERSEPKWI